MTETALATGATGLLADFNGGGVLGLADVHTARAVGRIGGEVDDRVRLALALAATACGGSGPAATPAAGSGQGSGKLVAIIAGIVVLVVVVALTIWRRRR